MNKVDERLRYHFTKHVDVSPYDFASWLESHTGECLWVPGEGPLIPVWFPLPAGSAIRLSGARRAAGSFWNPRRMQVLGYHSTGLEEELQAPSEKLLLMEFRLTLSVADKTQVDARCINDATIRGYLNALIDAMMAAWPEPPGYKPSLAGAEVKPAAPPAPVPAEVEIAPGASSPEAAERPEPAAGANVFRRNGEIWDIVFEGRLFRLLHRKGLQYLAILLGNPGQYIAAATLVAMVDGTLAAPDAAAPSEDEAVSRAGFDRYHVLDAQAKREFRERLGQLGLKRSEAEINLDKQAIERIDQEAEAIERQLSAARGLGGRPRTFAGPDERARNSVQKAIRSAVDQIQKHDPALFDHLRASIETGATCCYRPGWANRSIRWQV